MTTKPDTRTPDGPPVSLTPNPLRAAGTNLAILLGFLCIGVAVALFAPQQGPSATERMSIVQPVAIESMAKYGDQGFFVWLPPPSPEVAKAIEQGWGVDEPDNVDAPDRCRHGLRINGVRLLDAHATHQAIGTSRRGGFSIWGESIDRCGAYFSPPSGMGSISTLEVEWQLTRQSAEAWARARYAPAMIAVGLALLAIFLRPMKQGWAGTALFGCAGMSLAVPALAILGGAMSQQAMEDLHHKALASVSWTSAACVTLAMLIAVCGGRWNCFGRDFAVTTVLAALAVGVVAGHQVAGRTGFGYEAAAFDRSGVSSTLIAARLPFSDAGGWFVGSEAVLNGASINWSARRPVHACVRAGQLALGGGYDGSLILASAFLAASAVALACAVWSCLSQAAAIVVIIAILQASHGFERSFLSECVGLSIACISAALLIDGSTRAATFRRFGGAALLGTAWLVRPGPVALLALPALAEMVIPQPKRWRNAMIALAVVIAVLLTGKVFFKALAADDAVENANAAPTVYGLATGMTWGEAYSDFAKSRPESKTMKLPEYTAAMYREAANRFLRDPWPCVRKLWNDLQEGFREAVLETPGRLWLQPIWKSISPSSVASHATGWLLLGAAAWIALKGRDGIRSPASCMGIAAVCAVSSLPIIWGDGGMRGTIMAVPFVVAFFSVPIATLQHLLARGTRMEVAAPRIAANAALGMLVAFVLAGVAASAFSRGNSHERLPIERSLGRTPSVILTDGWRDHGVLGTALVPSELAAASLSEVRLYGLDTFVRGLSPGTALVLAANCETPSSWIVIEGLGERTKGRLMIESTEPTANPYFVRATNWHWLD
jgi:hypothetical protein